jgi:hypothetical protein
MPKNSFDIDRSPGLDRTDRDLEHTTLRILDILQEPAPSEKSGTHEIKVIGWILFESNQTRAFNNSDMHSRELCHDICHIPTQ